MKDLEEMRRKIAERRASPDYVDTDPRAVALEKARGYVNRAEEIAAGPGSDRPAWITAYATLALAELAVWK